ncbi:hypothetical protein Tco_1490697 [Tanacetum coccineum]
MLLREILHDVVGTSGYHCGVLQSFMVERIARKRVVRSSHVVMDPAGRHRSPWNEHPFCMNRMVSDQRGTTLFPMGSSMVYLLLSLLEVIDECESMRKSWCEEYNRNMTVEAELSKMNELSKTYAYALNEFFVINDLKALLQAKEFSISNLRAHIATLKGKNVSDNNEPVNNASVIAPGMFKLDLEPLSHRLKNNREAREDYLKKTKEHTNTLRGIVKRARKLNPSDPYLDYALITSTSASDPQSKNNTRKNRITSAASSNKKNKTVEFRPRKVMSNSNKRNHVSMYNANFKNAVKDANSKLCVKSKSGKSQKMEWKPTGKVFTIVGHRWLPTGRTFTINGTKCPLTRITFNPIVHPTETIQTPIITPNPEVKVYRRITKVVKSVVQIVLWYLDSGCSKHMTGQRSQLINFVEIFLGTVRFGNDHIEKIMGYGDYQIGNITISRVYYVEGLRHNLFSVGADPLTCSNDHVNREIVETIHVDFDELTTMSSKQSSSRPALHEMTPGTISLGLMHNPPSTTPYVPPTKNYWDLLFQPMFDEYFNTPPSVVSPVHVAAAPRPADLTSSPSSTSIDQVAPFESTSSTIHKTQSLVICEGVEEKLEYAQLVDDPFLDILTSKPSFHKSSSNVKPTNPPFEHISK